MESADGQKSEATTHKANGLDEGACGGAKTVFEGQAAGEENFKVMKRTVGALRQKARALGIRLGHRR
jgi:hypothetical protein